MVLAFHGTLITRRPDFYLAAAAIDNALWGFVFSGSLLMTRPLIQIFAELLNPGLGSKEFLDYFEMPDELYRIVWKLLTILWAAILFVKAIILIYSQLKLPLEVFIMIRITSGLPVMVLMLIFTYRFPGWYWQRVRNKKN